MIIAGLKRINIINNRLLDIQITNIRNISFPSVRQVFSKYLFQPAEPPYDYICQIGDPVLQTKASPVDLKELQKLEFQIIFEKLTQVMRKYKLIGIAAPQVGIPLQIFAIEMTEKCLSQIDPQKKELYKIESIPPMYFVNPKMKILNDEQVTAYESCGSLMGFQAEVPRAKEIEIKALNRLGEPFTWQAKDWTARIAQHEFDHLNGICYTSKMNPSTFEFIYWKEIHAWKGKVELHYKP